MAATLTTEPASPASAYRPLNFELTRTDPTVSHIAFIRPATASDVSTLGNGLVEGDILMQHQPWSGPVPGIVGQTVSLLATCDQYAGVWTILSAFTVGSDEYSVIDAPDLGDFTPPTFGTGRIWLNGYTIWAEISVYTDPAGDPQVAYMFGVPDDAGVIGINVAPVVASYFSKSIEEYVKPWTGTLIQHAHGITALFYRVRFVEVYDVPGEAGSLNPWEDGEEVHADSAHRVAVNAVHPYHSALTTWETASMSDFVVANSARKFLTNAPRTLTLGSADSFRLHILTGTGFTFEQKLRVQSVNEDGSVTGIALEDVTLGSDVYAAVSIAVGPADIAPYVTVPGRYRVFLQNLDHSVASETFDITVDSNCKEVQRPLGWLSKLGGVDLFTFTGREIESSDAQRQTVRKPMGTGTGYDWSERAYASQPGSKFTLSTAPIPKATREWIARDLVQTPLTALKLSSTQVTPIILSGAGVVASNTGGIHKPLTIEYRRGTDALVQQA